MYSGTTLRKKSGGVIGAHQKIDKVARRHLRASLPQSIDFPGTREILHFEGKDGPDGIKRKSPARDEPWHYIDPSDPNDTELLTIIEDHVHNLTAALADRNDARAAFEAAWLAHAIVDGLTPAHHYPLEEKLEELRGGEGIETRTTFRKKVVMPGENRREQVKNNWELWGAKGVMTTHFLFEIGFATTIAPLKLDKGKPSPNDRIRVEAHGVKTLFLESLHQIYDMKLYDDFHRKGWTRGLARKTRERLAPTIVRTVVLAWHYSAVKAAERVDRRSVS